MAESSTTGGFDCLHPTIEQRGRIKEDGESTFKVSIQDCLACSGCGISTDEITIISEQNTQKIFEKIDELSSGYVVIVSTSCIANLAAVKEWSVKKAFASIKNLFIKKGAKKVVLETDIQEIWRKLLIKEFIEHDTQSPFLISRCAGSVVYYQRKTTFGSQLAQLKPHPQLFANFEKKVINETNYVIYIGPCYDRKLEAAHFEGEIDAVLTISELNEFLEEPSESDEEEIAFPQGNDADYMTNTLNQMKAVLGKDDNEDEQISFVKQFEPLLSDDEIFALIPQIRERLNREDIKCGSYEGETANKRLTNIIKNNRPCPKICLIDYCKGGCCAGGGLIRGDTPAKRRALIAATQKIHSENEKEIEANPELYHKIIEMGYSTVYESVQQDVEENKFDW